MTQEELDARFASFMQRHSLGCGGVTVERPESIMPGLTLRVRCRCGVAAEWWLPRHGALAASTRQDRSHRLSA